MVGLPHGRRAMVTATLRQVVAGASSLLLFALSSPALAEYQIQPGDTLEFAVAGLPDLRQRGLVGPDGTVALPMTSPVKVAGLDLVAAQALVKERLSAKIYHQRTSDGRETLAAIPPDAITLTIAEFRPVYVNGDVTKPGEQTYRPGMTVLQAVAVAGGYEIMRFRMQNPFLESADLRNEYQSLWLQYAHSQAEIWRLMAQLDQNGAVRTTELETMTQAPLAKEVLDAVRANAQSQFESAMGRLKAEKAFLQRTVKFSDEQIASLRARQIKDEENVQVDTTDYNRLKEFSERGNLPMTRLAEARRLFLFSAIQSLQTGVQLTSTLREREDAQRRLARVDEGARIEALAALDKATIALNGIRSRLQAVGEKITYTGMIRSQLTRANGARPLIRIIHPETRGGVSEVATETSLLQPGDTVEVALHTEVPGVTE